MNMAKENINEFENLDDLLNAFPDNNKQLINALSVRRGFFTVWNKTNGMFLDSDKITVNDLGGLKKGSLLKTYDSMSDILNKALFEDFEPIISDVTLPFVIKNDNTKDYYIEFKIDKGVQELDYVKVNTTVAKYTKIENNTYLFNASIKEKKFKIILKYKNSSKIFELHSDEVKEIEPIYVGYFLNELNYFTKPTYGTEYDLLNEPNDIKILSNLFKIDNTEDLFKRKVAVNKTTLEGNYIMEPDIVENELRDRYIYIAYKDEKTDFIVSIGGIEVTSYTIFENVNLTNGKITYPNYKLFMLDNIQHERLEINIK